MASTPLPPHHHHHHHQGDEDLTTEAHHDNAYVEDELWENQKREGINWVPAVAERGRFSDRFGRFRFDSLADAHAPSPPPSSSSTLGGGQVGEFTLQDGGAWTYAKTFAQLESGLAKGYITSGNNSTSGLGDGPLLCRWRKWARRREILRPSSDICVGWLGSKGRSSGMWKSRFYILVKPGGSCATSNSSNSLLVNAHNAHGNSAAHSDFLLLDGGEDDEPSSNDDEDGEEEEDMLLPAAATGDADHQAASSSAATTSLPPTTAAATTRGSARFFYLRRGFDDSRCAFPAMFDWNDLRKLPKRHIKHIKLPSSRGPNRYEEQQGGGRFAIKYSTGRKLVFNAGSADNRERWAEMLRDVLGDVDHSPATMGKKLVSAAFHAAKRSQQVMGFSLRRSSSVPTPPSAPLVVQAQAVSAATAATAGGVPVTMELMREPLTGALNIRVVDNGSSKGAGGGLEVLEVYDNCRELPSGGFPSDLFPGDVITHVQGESLLLITSPQQPQTAVARFRELASKGGRTVTIQLLRTRATTTTSSPRFSASSSKLKLSSSSPPKPLVGGSDDSEMEEPVSAYNSNPTSPTLLLPESTSTTPPLQLPPSMLLLRGANKRTQVPANALGLQSAQVRAACLKQLEQPQHSQQQLTYGRLRIEVGKQLHAGDMFDTDEWRLFFRDFLDYWVCDDIRYSTGGLDPGDFTPVIERLY